MLAGDHDDVAAASAVAAAGAAARDELLAPERKTAVAAVAGFHVNSYFIDKHMEQGQTAGWTAGQECRTTVPRLRMLTNLPMRPRSRNSTMPGDLGEQRVVLADADVLAGLDSGCRAAGR